MIRLVLPGAFCAGVLAFGAAAQAPRDGAESVASLPEPLRTRIAQRPEAFLREMASTLFTLAPDGRVTADAIAFDADRQVAEARAQAVAGMLRHDLDGDGAVSAEEGARAMAFLATGARRDLALLLIEADRDGDGALSSDEIAAHAAASTAGTVRRRADLAEIIAALDIDGDGATDLTEVAQVVASIQTQPNPPRPPRRLPFGEPEADLALCDVPRPPPGAETVFLGGYEGAGLSTIAVAGQDSVTSVARVAIREGDAPLWVFANAYTPVVWLFEGETDRIAHVVVEAHARNGFPGAAVAGAAADRVTLVQRGACLKEPVHERDAEADAGIAALGAHVGQAFDHILTAHEVASFQVPIGVEAEVEALLRRPYEAPVHIVMGGTALSLSQDGVAVGEGDPVEGTARPMREIMTHHPGGIVPLDVAEVIPREGVAPYTVLPRNAGLAQLVALALLDPPVDRADRTYRIIDPIPAFPAGHYGGGSVRFVLPDGIGMPTGSLGNASVYSADGRCLAGRECR